MTTQAQRDFLRICVQSGSVFTYHKDDSTNPCPCVEPDGSRNPEWHLQHPLETVCNAAGMLPNAIEFTAKGFLHPVQSGAVRRLTSEDLMTRFGGTVESDDHLGILPLDWSGNMLDFSNWGQATEDYVEYDGKKFQVVSVNKITDPMSGDPHHWEVGLRLI